MTILVTGFDAHDDGVNASRVLLESLRDDLLDALGALRSVIHFALIPHGTLYQFVHVPALPVQAQNDLPAVPFTPFDMVREALTLVLLALQVRA